MIEKIVGAFLGAPAEQLAEYFKEKQRLKSEFKLEKLRGRIADQKARNGQAENRAAENHTWEMAHLANMGGYKDEFVLGVVSTPVIMGFIPGMSGYALAGFAVLDKMPVWYQVLLVTIYLAIYGIRAAQGKNIVGRMLGNGEEKREGLLKN